MKFTDGQLQVIVSGIEYGREALRKRGLNPVVFAEAFLRLGAIQIPGRPTATTTKKRLGEAVMTSLRAGVPTITADFDDAERATVYRELLRCHQETHWTGSLGSPELVGFSVILRAPVDEFTHRAFVKGGGFSPVSSLFPPPAIVVLPSACDGARFRPIFEHQVRSIEPVAGRIAPVSGADLTAGIGRIIGEWFGST